MTTNTYHLYDSETAERIGTASDEQIEVSSTTEEGYILIDPDGNVVKQGSWAAQQPGVRKVYVA